MMKKRKNLTGYLGENMLKRNILKSLLRNIVFKMKKQKGIPALRSWWLIW